MRKSCFGTSLQSTVHIQWVFSTRPSVPLTGSAYFLLQHHYALNKVYKFRESCQRPVRKVCNKSFPLSWGAAKGFANHYATHPEASCSCLILTETTLACWRIILYYYQFGKESCYETVFVCSKWQINMHLGLFESRRVCKHALTFTRTAPQRSDHAFSFAYYTLEANCISMVFFAEG